MRFFKPRSLNSRGIAHYMVPMVVIVLTGLVGTYLLVGSHADSVSRNMMILFSDGGKFDRAKIKLNGGAPAAYSCGGKFDKSGDSKSNIIIPGPTAKKAGFKPITCTPTGKGVSYDVTFGTKSTGTNAVNWQPASVNVVMEAGTCMYVHVTGVTQKTASLPGGGCAKSTETDTTAGSSAAKPKPTKAPKAPKPSKSPARAASAVKFNVASYNVLGASHTDSDSADDTKSANSGPRMVRAVGIMNKNNFDVVGLQEFQPPQRQKLLDETNGSYDIYPSPADWSANFSQNSIIWKRSKFSLVGAGALGLNYYGGSVTNNAWVELREKASGQEFFVFNAHYPATTAAEPSPNNHVYREQDARIELAAAEAKIATGKPVILTGDFNSSFKVRPDKGDTNRSLLVYCILTSSGHIRHAQDVAQHRTGACPQTKDAHIDHIYVGDGVGVKSYKHIVNSDTNYASDHDPVVATISL